MADLRNLKLAVATRNSMVDAVTALIDAGGAGNPGKIQIYDGTIPGADEAVSTQTLLAELTFTDPATGAFAAASNGSASANAITDDSSANASGTASWFQVVDSAGTVIFRGSVGPSGDGNTYDMTLDDVNIVAGGVVQISSFTFTQPTNA